MTSEESLRFVQERLRHHHAGPLTRELHLGPQRSITRRFAIELGKGDAQSFERVDPSVRVFCTRGSVWITHDGDCKDVILLAGESYRAEREEAMHLFALEPCVMEIEFEDEAFH